MHLPLPYQGEHLPAGLSLSRLLIGGLWPAVRRKRCACCRGTVLWGNKGGTEPLCGR